jgi:hypothetical protein
VKSALSCVAASFLLLGAEALSQPVPEPIEPYRPASFPVRTVAGPDHPIVTFGGTIKPQITSRSSVPIATDVCGHAATMIGGHMFHQASNGTKIRPAPGFSWRCSGAWFFHAWLMPITATLRHFM